jgi:hypothetical protein
MTITFLVVGYLCCNKISTYRRFLLPSYPTSTERSQVSLVGILSVRVGGRKKYIYIQYYNCQGLYLAMSHSRANNNKPCDLTLCHFWCVVKAPNLESTLSLYNTTLGMFRK